MRQLPEEDARPAGNTFVTRHNLKIMITGRFLLPVNLTTVPKHNLFQKIDLETTDMVSAVIIQ